MARIEKYNIDNKVTDYDKFIGTDSAGNVTRNYRASSIADYLNNYGKIGVGGQISYKFTTNVAPRTWGTLSFASGSGDNTSFSDITSIYASKYNTSNVEISDLISYYEGKSVFIFQFDNPNNFAEYTLDAVSVVETDFFDLSLSFVSGNGSILDEKYYGLVLISTNDNYDKTYTHNQSISSDTWVVNHNLKKYPSVLVQDSAGSTVIGEITYNDENTITLTFSGAFSGKAHLN